MIPRAAALHSRSALAPAAYAARKKRSSSSHENVQNSLYSSLDPASHAMRLMSSLVTLSAPLLILLDDAEGARGAGRLDHEAGVSQGFAPNPHASRGGGGAEGADVRHCYAVPLRLAKQNPSSQAVIRVALDLVGVGGECFTVDGVDCAHVVCSCCVVHAT